MKRVLFSVFCMVYLTAAENIALYAILTPGGEPHTLYNPGDADIPHTFPFYNDRAKDPVHNYDNARAVCTFLLNPDTNE
ncbi:MAG: hypothetical protein KGQ49_07300, partial [Verrucomicrobia bacterium]|nr:hypothetical protein [Verrucomicrobiota bacterium]